MEVQQVVRNSDGKLLTWLRLPEDSPLHAPGGVYLVPNLLHDQEDVFGRRLERKPDHVKRTYTRVDGRALLTVLERAGCSDSGLYRLRMAIGSKEDGTLILLGRPALEALGVRDLHPPLHWCEGGALPAAGAPNAPCTPRHASPRALYDMPRVLHAMCPPRHASASASSPRHAMRRPRHATRRPLPAPRPPRSRVRTPPTLNPCPRIP